MSCRVKTLAERLSFLMEQKNLRQRPLADLAKVQNTAIHRWVNGQTTNPGKDDLEKVAKVLGTTALWLRTGEGPMVPSPFAGVTAEDFRGAAEKPEPYGQQLDLDLLRRVLLEVLTQAPTEPPERLADITTKAYDTALRTQRQDRIAKIVEMLVS